jgi:DNA end-binding protein Ku
MGDSDKAAIASFVMRGKEYLAAVRADGDLLALETLFFADEYASRISRSATCLAGSS